MTLQQDRGPDRCWPALLAVPVLCYAGPSLLAAVGVGSATATLGGATGSLLLAGAGAAVVLVAVVVVIVVVVVLRHRSVR